VLPRNDRVNGSVGVVPVPSVAADVAVVSAAEVVAAAVSSSLIASVAVVAGCHHRHPDRGPRRGVVLLDCRPTGCSTNNSTILAKG